MTLRCLPVSILLLVPTGAPPPVSPQAGGQPAASKPPVFSAEARWSDAYCDVTELARSGPSELTVRFRYRNQRKTPLPLPHANLIAATRAFDPAARTLYGVIKDPDGKPLSSTPLSGAAARPVPASGTQAHWARLEAPPDTVTAVALFIDGCQPLENVPIGGSGAGRLLSAPLPALASQDAEIEGVMVDVTGVERVPGGFMNVTVRYRNTGSTPARFPHERHMFRAYVVDPSSRRKYEVAKDKTGGYLLSETLELYSATGQTIPPGTAINLWAKLPAPPDGTKSVSLYLPFAPPFDSVAVAGTAAGSAGGGMAVAGAVTGLDAALKDLGAKVTDTEIRIDMAADVLFDFDKADIKPEAAPVLRKVATVLEGQPGARVSIEGHTDAKGADAYNQTLSERRAASVRQWLVANAGVDGSAVTTRGWGMSKPVAHNTMPDGSDNPEGRAKNRRVEIIVRKR